MSETLFTFYKTSKIHPDFEKRGGGGGFCIGNVLWHGGDVPLGHKYHFNRSFRPAIALSSAICAMMQPGCNNKCTICEYDQ